MQGITAKGSLVWGVCALFFLYEFFLRTVVGAYQGPIMEELGISSFQFSLFSSTLFLAMYGLMQLPAGVIIDNIGLKRSLLLGVISCALSSFALVYASGYIASLLCRVCMGFGASFGFICLLMAVKDWLPQRYSGAFIGISQFIGTMGPMLAAGPLETFSESSGMGWRDLFMYLGFIGLALALLVTFFVVNSSKKTGKYIVLMRPQKIGVVIRYVLARSQPWWIASLSAILYFSVEYLSENEGRTFLGLKGVGKEAAAYMLTMSWVGYALSCPIMGALSDLLERRKVWMVISSFLCLIATVIIVYSKNQTLLYMGFVGLGVAAGGQSVGFATIAEQFKEQFTAVGFGLNNAMITVLSAINAPLLGLLIDKTSNHFWVLDSYVYVFTVLIVLAVLACIISTFFLKETYGKSQVSLSILSS